jgi:dipeptidyl aminopeptidase/acylaminoacyl peptidase
MSRAQRLFAGALLLVFITASVAVGAGKRAITVEDMWAMKRIGSLALSPDGKWIAFSLTEYSMEQNRGRTDIFLVSTRTGELRQLTTYSGYDGHPVWMPDGERIAFVSTRDGSPQIYLLDLRGGEARKLTDLPTGVQSFVVSPDGKYFLVQTEVYPEAKTLEESARMDRKRKESKVKARIITRLLYRHWNRWLEGKRRHVYLVAADGSVIRDVTPGDFDTPPISLGSGHDFTFSPDGKEIAFVRNEDPVVAISTNNDIFVVPVAGGERKKITESRANDNQPVYSPDGRYIAYHAMARPGFEADQYDLMLYDRKTGSIRNLTEQFDRDVDEIVWSPDSRFIYFNSRNEGRRSVFRIRIRDGKIEELIHDHINTSLAVSPDGRSLYFRRQCSTMPYEIFVFDLKKKKERQLTFVNRERLAQLQMNHVEDFWFESFDGRKVHGFLLKPPFFEPGKKYPMVYLIHGGPQGMWSDDFHYRWNSQMFASPGYIVAMVNFRGSKGYGQWFCDQVSKDWGGGPYKDLMAGLDYLYRTYDFIDTTRVAAAGASYGGFMINWIAGHTDRFRCLVSHDGVAEQVSMYGATEELWFPEWEFGGTPYENPELYDRFSPVRYAKNFKTPMLLIHGEQDFRVPYTQGLQMFTALQRMGVPSKLLYFPDEDHFVTKPQNARLWWNTVLGWIAEWINKE